MSVSHSSGGSRLCTGHDAPTEMSRRGFLARFGHGVGAMALGHLMGQCGMASASPLGVGLHHAARAKRVIFLVQAGAPSQMDLWDY